MFFTGFPQPWRSLFRGLFAAFVIVFVVGLVTDVDDGVVTGVLLGIVAIQLGLGIYVRRRGLLEQPQPGGRWTGPRTSGGRVALGAAAGLAIGLVITALNGGFDTDDGDDSVGANPNPPPGVVSSFRSPAGVVCRLTAREARCGIAEFSFVIPRAGPSSCADGRPFIAGVAAGDTTFGCQFALPAEEDSSLMPAEGSIKQGPLSCSSSPAGGVHCVSERTRAAHGFTLSAEHFEAF